MAQVHYGEGQANSYWMPLLHIFRIEAQDMKSEHEYQTIQNQEPEIDFAKTPLSNYNPSDVISDPDEKFDNIEGEKALNYTSTINPYPNNYSNINCTKPQFKTLKCR